jgi:hypothetical protein
MNIALFSFRQRLVAAFLLISFFFSCQLPYSLKAENAQDEFYLLLGEGQDEKARQVLINLEEQLIGGDSIAAQRQWPLENALFESFLALDEFEIALEWNDITSQHLELLAGKDSHDYHYVGVLRGFCLRRMHRPYQATKFLEGLLESIDAGWGLDSRIAIDTQSELADVTCPPKRYHTLC